MIKTLKSSVKLSSQQKNFRSYESIVGSKIFILILENTLKLSEYHSSWVGIFLRKFENTTFFAKSWPEFSKLFSAY